MLNRRVLMRRPAPGLGQAVVSLIDREPVDVARAIEQWEALRSALGAAGWEVVVVEEHEDDPPCPDGVFVGDAVMLLGDRVMLPRSAVESRRPERPAIRRALASRQVPITHMRRPGTADGGDVVQVGDSNRVFVGVGTRTNRAGLAQIVHTLGPESEVVPVMLHKTVQLNAGLTALPCGTVLGYPPLVDDPSVFDTFVPVPEPGGAHAFPLGGSRVLVPASAPRSLATITDLGYEPVVVDISEFEKREGTMTCLLAPF